MGTNLGDDWNEVTGDWEILDNELHEKIGGGGTANAKVICTRAVPSRSAGEMLIAVDVVDAGAGDVFYIYPSCSTTTAVGDVSVSFTFDGTSTWTISITAGDSSGSSEMTKTPTGGKVGLYVCCDYQSRSVFAGVEGGLAVDADVGPAWADDATFTAGRYAGLGHNNGGGATFDDFYLYELRKTAYQICQECACSCDGIIPSKTLVATVYNATDRALCLQDEDWEMYWEYGSGTSYWEGDLVTTYNDPSETITWRLSCDSSNYDATAFAAPGTVSSGITTDPGTDDWDNVNDVKVDDDFNYASASCKNTEPTKFLKCTNFGFAIPTGAEIVGVEVNIQKKASVSGDVQDYGVYLYNSDSAPVGDNKKSATAWSDTETSVRYGGSNDTWSRSLTEAIVESSSFGVIISAVGGSSTSRTAEIDYVEMKIYFKYRAGYNWKLQISNSRCCASNAGGCSAVVRSNAGSSCNGLSLNFGPFYLSQFDLNCNACEDAGGGYYASGEYYVTITEPPPPA